jgi:hypothetical protein
MSSYQDDFYKDLHQQTLYPARTVIDILLPVLPSIGSAVDVGCAVGSWLSVLKENGVPEIRGIDGDWVNKEFLEIPGECFRAVDLEKPFSEEKKYDLAMSLEVAEHLPASSAAGFVASLAGLADFVLFSAAIPFQGGTSHVNEQWLEYWCRLFSAQGFRGVDCIRRRIWHDEKIPFWYKQNLVLFARENRLAELKLPEGIVEMEPVSLVHPEQYLSARVAFRIVKDNIGKRIRKFV